jgi:hypothetical protein
MAFFGDNELILMAQNRYYADGVGANFTAFMHLISARCTFLVQPGSWVD